MVSERDVTFFLEGKKIRVKIAIRVSIVKQMGAIRVSFESNDEKPFMSLRFGLSLVPFSLTLKTVPRISLPYCGYDLISALNAVLHVCVLKWIGSFDSILGSVMSIGQDEAKTTKLEDIGTLHLVYIITQQHKQEIKRNNLKSHYKQTNKNKTKALYTITNSLQTKAYSDLTFRSSSPLLLVIPVINRHLNEPKLLLLHLEKILPFLQNILIFLGLLVTMMQDSPTLFPQHLAQRHVSPLRTIILRAPPHHTIVLRAHHPPHPHRSLRWAPVGPHRVPKLELH
ncbi:RNA-binding (RRM/RBD/RNP motifs) family protein [Striga asiatica]|uniref:RNA-binding (RRM/RBD/RNP motifs) family protein n=1 Tax=Striga asiatica TaxID=4170 RepID=A0A5A7QZP6_STRAF|nr:RNA-binding (RRM/RBD/RNP motifs) family protein [Striga asiatica]